MRPLKQLLLSTVLLSFFFAKSQQIDWNKVNSNTIVNLISSQNFDKNISSSTTVFQLGDYNNAELSVNSKTNVVVQQLGDENSIYFNNSFSEKESKAAITTQGNNNIIDVTGTNSISDGMNITIKGDYKTIFIRNY